MTKKTDDDNILSFSGDLQHRSEELRATNMLRGSQPNVTHNAMHIAGWRFTCNQCSKIAHFRCEYIIFRTIDFYCSSCGKLHRVINPAFSVSVDPLKK